jgi:hypothetical protein
MLKTQNLPACLVELTMSRLCARQGPRQYRHVLSIRHAHAATRLSIPSGEGFAIPPPGLSQDKLANSFCYLEPTIDYNNNRKTLERKHNQLGLHPRAPLDMEHHQSELEMRVKALEDVATDEVSNFDCSVDVSLHIFRGSIMIHSMLNMICLQCMKTCFRSRQRRSLNRH